MTAEIGGTDEKNRMLREVIQPEEQASWDAQQRLDGALDSLIRIDWELVEWTLAAVDAEGKRLSASFLVTDACRPLEQLADILRCIADQVEGLASPG